jgi:MtrB/PioB family decaheme-associated outer membrane protein
MTDRNERGFAGGGMQLSRIGLIALISMLTLLTVAAPAQNNPGTQTTPERTQATPQVKDPDKPENKIQLGIGGVSDDSFKFGEYNGLQNQGPFGMSNFFLRGGAAYDSNSTWRWRLEGTNLGLEDRNLFAEFGKQGKFRFRLMYDELLANRSDTFQTPYLGIGTNNLTLPSNWLKPFVPQANANNVNFRSFDPVAGTGSVYNSSGVLTAPTAAQLATLSNIRAADLPDFHRVNLATKRTRGDAAFAYSPTEHWEIPVGFSREHKQGRKALGAVTSQVSENSIVMPYVVDWDTDQADAALLYKSKKLFVAAGYYGSYFHNNTASMTWQDVTDPTKSTTLAEEPSNQFSQLSVTAAYKVSRTAKLVVAGAYGRSTQDQAFLDPTTASNGQLAFGLPRASLNGLVVNSMVNAKFTAARGKRWNFLAAYKYDNRDNQTPVNIYLFQDANESKSAAASPFAGRNGLPTTVGSNTNIYNNRAYSRLIHQANLQAEYGLTKGQYLQLGYDWQRIGRRCSGSWIDCADARVVTENTLRAEWRKSMGTLTARLGYAYSLRRGDYNENAFLSLVPMANFVPAGGATTSVLGYLQQTGFTGFGPVAGFPSTPLTGDAAIFSPNNNIVPQALYGSRNNINEIPGFRRYFVADRNRNRVRSNVEWQATQQFSLQGTGEFNDDDYLNSKYGLTRGTYWAATLDANYAPGDNFVVDLFYTYDNQRFGSAGDAYGSNSNATFQGQAANTIVSGGCFSTVAAKNLNAKIDPCLNWFKNNRDKIDTLGFTIRRQNLKVASRKLELADELIFTRARTSTGVGGGSYVNNPLALAAPAPPLAAGTPAVFFIPASDYPLLRNDQFSVRPSATYAITKTASLQGFYWFQRLMATDWAYLGMQYGTGTNYMPTNERAPSYNVHVAGVSLTYTF